MKSRDEVPVSSVLYTPNKEENLGRSSTCSPEAGKPAHTRSAGEITAHPELPRDNDPWDPAWNSNTSEEQSKHSKDISDETNRNEINHITKIEERYNRTTRTARTRKTNHERLD